MPRLYYSPNRKVIRPGASRALFQVFPNGVLGDRPYVWNGQLFFANHIDGQGNGGEPAH
jgi:hypothetical protein